MGGSSYFNEHGLSQLDHMVVVAIVHMVLSYSLVKKMSWHQCCNFRRALFLKYKGREEEVYNQICDKSAAESASNVRYK